MSQRFPVPTAPVPTSPLNYVANKGEVRQSGPDFYTWDGHEWVLTAFPSAQLVPPPVMPEDDGSVQLPNGLWVSGSGAEAGSTASLWVEGPAHATGDLGVDGRVYTTDVQFVRRSALGAQTRYLQDVDFSQAEGPQGWQFTSKLTTNGGVGGGESYAGVGVTWVYDATRRLKITSKVIILAISSSGGAWESRAILRGGLGTGVSTSDPRMDLSPITCFANARNAHQMITEIPPGTWADGAQVYVALFVDTFGPATYSFQRLSDPGFPTYVTKEDWGT